MARTKDKQTSCCGAAGIDQNLVEDWIRALMLVHPDWSLRRVQVRAWIETMKGKKP